ncbi:alanine--tRNA ligase [Selaginella moellendorffii]|uniref:alanine--tRNA ligase n=1 Tax=Selaginella moellendorffii TaxID=88036 RepID=UPI000D1C37E1|nr:alanine--tRNA ligase [Selaginella moellendorffii]|eukprot:XP_024518599.1 alanine--tRNA ligase [Selaginella moellendorffii]
MAKQATKYEALCMFSNFQGVTGFRALLAMEEWSSSRVRRTFVKYFEDREHQEIASSSLIPLDDPTLLFTNSGVVQFKRLLLESGNHNARRTIMRACNSQKCIRAGGKHNDLEDVGKDTYHHTFFEMLGSWSFGDYFKEEAITWAWELLTQVYKLSKDRLFATYFGGDDSLGLSRDTEARDIWLKFLPPQRVLPFGCKDNFWEMGETGPCGPCSEIHYDRLGGRDGSAYVNMDDPTCIELWNLVFMQFNRETDGKLTPLSTRNVDTGMGLERLVSVLQNKSSNYDTDLFAPIFDAIQKATSAGPYLGRMGDDDVDLVDTAYRVLADHARTLTFAITDGCRPGSEGAGYVLRRILRRAVRYGVDIMKAKHGFFNGLVDVVVTTMGEAYPALNGAKDTVKKIIAEEEASFTKTLTKGVERFHKAAAEVKDCLLSGQVAFLLWDTYGFPLDLTQLMAREQYGFQVDENGFNRALEDAKRKSRDARSKARGVDMSLEAAQISQLRTSGVAPTSDSNKYVYQQDHETRVAAIFGCNSFTDTFNASVDDNSIVGLVLESTSFYSEQGGQMHDIGTIEACGFLLQVTDVRCFGGYVLHVGIPKGSVSVGDVVVAKVEYANRSKLAANHTGTHLLSSALRKVLGDHVEQTSSLVAPDKLRFGFRHGAKLELREIEEVERLVVNQIRRELQVYTKEVSLEEANRIKGLRTVPGEMYPDPVRVVSVGLAVENQLTAPFPEPFSTELCGGTHLSNTREAGEFTIVTEESTSNGARQAVALTGALAKLAIARGEEFACRVSNALKLTSSEQLEKEMVTLKPSLDAAQIPLTRKLILRGELDKLQDRVKELNKVSSLSNQTRAMDDALRCAESALQSCCVVRSDVGLDVKAIRKAVSAIMAKVPDIAIMLFSVDVASGKALVYAGVPPSNKRIVAVEWLRKALEPLEGKGGGNSETAQGQAGSKIEFCSNKDARYGFLSNFYRSPIALDGKLMLIFP